MAKPQLDEARLPFASLPELGAALRERQISAHELAKFFFNRLKNFGGDYNAVACLTEKRGMRAAKYADEDFKDERIRSPLQGIPYGAKDLFAAAGYPTTWGAKPFADQKFKYDAAVISKLDGHGAVLLAKLAMIQLAGGGDYSSASASLQGPCLNPWNKAYWAGGSSSGSAAAVCAGLLPFALGSETSGSIITPGSYCGLSGLRPTYGLVSRRGAMALSWTLDKVGVLARSAEDCGLVLHEIAGSDEDDPGSARKSFHYVANYYRKLSDLKVGYAGIDFHEWPDAALRPAYAATLETVKSMGSQMVESKLPDFRYGLLVGTIIHSEAASIFEPLIRSDAVEQLGDAGQIAGLKAALNYTAVDYLKAQRIRRQVVAAFGQLMAEIDLLIAPARLFAPDRADRPFDTTPPKLPETKGLVAGLVQAGNLCGLPAITIPCGFVDGLPIGLQIVGSQFQENTVLAFARGFQERTDFHRQHPNAG
jgi:aspartyl-tRNA(Asn)/glutamyl-tRNA(Gln) amidotransferase subunit A